MVDFETCPDCSTNFTDYVHMIPLYLVLLVVVVAFVMVVSQPFRPDFGAAKVVVNDSNVERTRSEHVSSTKVDCLPSEQALLVAFRFAVGRMLGLQYRTIRNRINAGCLAGTWSQFV